ncbi:MAG TPA: helix-turn-helix domain-containing protein [Pseudonocardia sp.]|jgi:AcrR family transcriptional regulator|nr:helix-turn-helix domain-containing protein [Pseudonocardia sp.]
MVAASPSTARHRRRERTRYELAEAAVRLIEANGFAATTVEEIALAADYSASTFFRLFTRKEDAVLFDMPDRLDALRASITAPSGWPALRAALLDHARTWEAGDPAFAAARVRLLHREPALKSRYLDYCDQYEDWLAGLLGTQRAGDGWAADVDIRLTAASIVACLRAAFHAQASAAEADVPSAAAYLSHAFDTLERGLLSSWEPGGANR